MNILSRIRNALGLTPALRNKPGGMAWINAKVDEGDGAEVLVNRIVRTVRIVHSDYWQIEPPQQYTLKRDAINTPSGLRCKAGTRVLSVSMRDECLTPIPGLDISDEEVRELYAPKLPEVA